MIIGADWLVETVCSFSFLHNFPSFVILSLVKQTIHPEYFKDAKFSCACGNTFTAGSTRKAVRVEICYNCHPFYTGLAKFVDTEGRVEAFKRREVLKTEAKVKKVDDKKEFRPKTLKEMLQVDG